MKMLIPNTITEMVNVVNELNTKYGKDPFRFGGDVGPETYDALKQACDSVEAADALRVNFAGITIHRVEGIPEGKIWPCACMEIKP